MISIECESVQIGASSGIKKATFITLYQFLKLLSYQISITNVASGSTCLLITQISNHLIQSFTQHVNNLTIVINMLKILNPT